MYNIYKKENIESKIRALETIWYGWVEYFRPAKVSSQSRHYETYKKNVRRYEMDHVSVITEISKNAVGSVEGMNATNALFVQKRIAIAYAELRAMRVDSEEYFLL